MKRREAVEFLKNHPAKFGKLLGFTKLKAVHNKWIISMLLDKDDRTLQASRGTYKTTCVSIALALIIVLHPNKRTLFMRKTDNDVKEVIKQVQNILKSQYMRYFVKVIYGIDLKLTVESATEVSTNLVADIKGTSQLVGLGLGSSLTGKHFDYIFTDDIVNLNDRLSAAERERTKSIYQELQNIKNRGGRIYNTGTPWHADDAFSIMPPADKYDCYHEEIREIITEEELEHIRKNMLPSLFAANYELRHIASEDVIFTNPQTGADISLVENGCGQLDAAYFGEDYTALTIANYHGGKWYVYGRCWRKHVKDVTPQICEVYKSTLCNTIYVENNADKGYVASDLKKYGVRTYSYHEKENKFIKITTHLKNEWENVIFVAGTDKEYIQMIVDYNEHAEHDDCPDSLASLIRAMRLRGNLGKDKRKPLLAQ